MYRSISRVISVVRKTDQPFGSKELIRKVYFILHQVMDKQIFPKYGWPVKFHTFEASLFY